MNNMKQDILSSIEKHLPAELSGVLQERLNAGDLAIEKVERMVKQAEEQKKLLNKQSVEIGILKGNVAGFEARERDLVSRESIVKEVELNQECNALRTRLDAEKRVSNNVMELTSLVFKNPVFKKEQIFNSSTSQDSPISDGNGGVNFFSKNDHKIGSDTTTETIE